jgi:hypothetical protein
MRTEREAKGVRRRILIRQLWTQFRRLWRPAMTSALVLASSSGCIEWKQPMEAADTGISTYIAAMQTLSGNAHAVLRTGTPPGNGSGPIVTAPLPSIALLGGTIQLLATAVTPFTTVAVIVPGVTDYWELTLPGSTTSVSLLVVLAQNIPKSVFTIRLGGAIGGIYGVLHDSQIGVISVGTGDVQFNITWNSPADLDLHVVDPSGEEIYYANRTSNTGGQLDLDSNAACASDGPRAENIFWASGLIAPRGDFYVRVDQWSACGAQTTDFVVTVHAKGRPPQVYPGTFIAPGDAGAKGAGRPIVILTY